ncbi:uncharacterized protein LOC123513695 isoform X2 [Portunus trituberculatus]|uniref:uncharacterized protein LOC123513695 isoform X2 n=1 Tax=Portunus trituberculatus TaxID=210409 RepID=UPI001E1CE32C|nr:uncharacterized protein LOC123513695 isoform X2 [Portunus trituberculatus]
MAGEARRGSVASSLLTELSAAPSVTEDEIAGLSVEQLESVGVELQALCSLLQAEVDLFTRYLSSQVQEEALQGSPSMAAASGSGTATPSVSSLDVRGLRKGQVVTRGTTRAAARLSERQKTRLWQRELEIVLANKRKREKMWQQELHKYQVSVLEAEACHKDLQKAQEGLTRLMPGTRRLSFDQIYKFMEEQLRVWLKQASQVWVQVSLLRGDLSKARVKRERRRGGHDPTGQPVSQINFLKQQLEHSEVKARVESNRGILSGLLQQLEKDSRRAMILEEENQRCGARLEELRCAMRETEREVDRLSLISGRIEMRVQRVNTSTKSKLLTLKSSPLQPTEVDEYLQLNGDIHKLRKEVAWWKRRAGDPV